MEWLDKIFRRRDPKSEESLRWSIETLERLVTEVIPRDIPYFAMPAFSFLQTPTPDFKDLTYIDLYIPDWNLFIDVLPQEFDPDFRIAKEYISRLLWEKEQKRLTQKTDAIALYRAPYLQIHHYDPTDATILCERIRSLIGVLLHPRTP